LHSGNNEVVIFDLFHAANERPMLAGLAQPILNASTPNLEQAAKPAKAPKTE
jgi:hypothetical protein